MPLFFRKRKPSEDAKKRLEYQLCLSKEAGADDILDISVCELSEVPSSALSICKVLQKKVLILHGNELRSMLPKTCDIISLATIKVLDLHENKLTSLPEDIGRLVLLQVLNVQQNQIKSLPDSIGNLQLLQTLNAKGNCLSEVPSSIGSLSSLRTLDLSDNNIHELPKAVAYIRTLESFTLDAADMSYPPASVCSGGTAEIQRFLCAELGEEYCPPSQYLLPVLESKLQLHSDYVDGEQAWKSKFNEYEKKKEQKLKETLAFELQLEESHKEHAQLLLMNFSHKENVLNSVRMEQERVEQGFCKQQRAVEAGRASLLARVKQAEHHVAGRITDLLMDASRQKKSAAFLTALEKDRIHMEHLTAITQEEANSLRKRDVADAMQKMLSDSVSMMVLQEASDFRRQNMRQEAFRSVQSLDMRFDQVLSLQQLDKSKAIAHILEEEEIQKAAFEALQLQKDSVHGYIRSQIKLIEDELMQLTKLEVKRRTLDAESLQGVLGDQRSALSDMLQQLLKQKDQREAELKQVLSEMERKSESSQQHYWMIQYQRLLESKPMSLRMEEAGVERSLVSLLCKLSAQHFLPILAHHHVTRHTLSHMTPSDLHKMGISEVGVQRALLDWAKQQQRLSTPKEAEEETAEAEAAAAPPSAPFPSASPPGHNLSTPSTPGTPVTPSAPSPLEGPGGSECVVCMETVAQVIFLPCGHVCCCRVCSDALQNCPLCRGSLEQRVRIYHN